MKKKIIIISCILVIAIICTILLIKVINSEKGIEYKSYYTVTYSATVNTNDILNNSDNYVIVNEESELKDILNKVNANTFEEFNEKFFHNNKLLIAQAGISPEMHTLNSEGKNVDVTIYHATPMTSVNQESEYNLYLIPISKDINNYNVKITSYPDRTY